MNNKKAYLIYNQFIDSVTGEPSIGGIQTYICDLASLFYGLGYRVLIVQKGAKDSSFEWNNYTIKNIGVRSDKLNAYRKKLANFIAEELKEDDFLVFMTHTLNCKTKHNKTISIQHGIYWDIPAATPKASSLIEYAFKSYRSWNEIKKVNLCKYCVAVDYNFLNWYKTLQYYQRTSICVIPNYSNVSDTPTVHKEDDRIKILFARRFEQYRGTRIFADAALKILKSHPNIDITFAGAGPDENYLKEAFSSFENVHFTRYKHGESATIHSQNDIAVVASVGSEGTSLSLLEAMASKCAVIATSVGGLTNIIVDGYNGLISDITSESLYDCLEKLINSKEFRNRLANNAFTTVRDGFSKKMWEKHWISMISAVEAKESKE